MRLVGSTKFLWVTFLLARTAFSRFATDDFNVMQPRPDQGGEQVPG